MVTIVLLAIGLAMDAFAVSITQAVRVPAVRFRQALAMASLFGLFQAGMPLLGCVVGCSLNQAIQAIDHWVAFGLLGIIGGKMVIEGIRGGGDDEDATDTAWPGLCVMLVLAVSTSIDAFAAGIGLPAMNLPAGETVTVIGAVTLFLSMIGIRFGKVLGERFGRAGEVGGGIVLLGIGTKVLVEHLGA